MPWPRAGAGSLPRALLQRHPEPRADLGSGVGRVIRVWGLGLIEVLGFRV